ncbi:MAG: pentapeptide repeat-containing protein [Chloroflexi bacterium]|nr:pentapeptide repeat-containing protein [Chloroflexota bacterium]
MSATVEDRAAADQQRRRRGPGRYAVALVALAALAAVAIWLVPLLQVEPAREKLSNETDVTTADRIALENQLFQSENAARATLAIIFGAAGLLLTAAVIWRRYEKSRELKTHEQFAKAVEQLGSERADGSPRTEARLGGIYALERLANETEREYWPIMEVFTAYVRDNAAWGSSTSKTGSAHRLAADVQATLAVLGRRKLPPHSAPQEKRFLDLRETDLRGANLSGSRLEGVSFFAAHLERADATRAVFTRSNLREAHLQGATLTEVDLVGASLSRANLEGARLNHANLEGADLSGANLRGADLWEANLKGCNLKDADLRGADLSACVLEEAILWRADLQDAVLTGARLRETHLERTNLLGVTGLTWEQGGDAYTDENTILPLYLQPESARAVAAAAAAAPTPAARRAPVQRAAPPPKPAPPPPSPPPTPEVAPAPPEEPATRDNVVELNAPERRTRARKTKVVEAKPKKSSVSKRRNPGLVKPA